jgi:D-psicose/D-tagatose/L-ribulose 3-epimerase
VIGVGVNAWVWTSPFTAESVELISRAKAIGFDAITIPVEEPAAIDGPAVRRALRDSGLRVHVTGAYGPSRDLTHDEPRFREESLRYIADTLALCELWGARLLVGPCYSAVGKRRHVPPEQRRREWERAVAGLRRAGALAEAHGVVLAVEPLNRFETDLVNTAEQLARLLRDVAHPAVKAHLDTFHMHIEEKDVAAAVREVGPALVYVDASESDRGTPGSGQVDWPGLAGALREIGYAGDCVIESFTPACQTIAAAAAIWRPLAPTQDALARDGHAFLRRLLADPSAATTAPRA